MGGIEGLADLGIKEFRNLGIQMTMNSYTNSSIPESLNP
jgi:hypothetical protein